MNDYIICRRLPLTLAEFKAMPTVDYRDFKDRAASAGRRYKAKDPLGRWRVVERQTQLGRSVYFSALVRLTPTTVEFWGGRFWDYVTYSQEELDVRRLYTLRTKASLTWADHLEIEALEERRKERNGEARKA